jgi:ribose transport system substrate-binding protein
MNSAIARGVDMIELSGAPKPELLQPQIKKAMAKGIPTATDHNFDRSVTRQTLKNKYSLVADTPAPFSLAAKLMADYAIVHANGGSVDALVLGPRDVSSSKVMFKALKNEFSTVCPDSCKMTILDTPHAKTSSQLVSSIKSSLQRDPNINYVMPVFDFLALDAAPAIQQLGRASKTKVVTYNGTPAVLDQMRKGDIVVMDAGESYEWVAYAAMDQALRVMSGAGPVTKEHTPIRVWTKDNVKEAGVPATKTNNFPTPTEYLQLWGISK